VPWTFNDGHGNSIVVNQVVIIDDTIAPIIPVLTDVVGQCSATATPPTTTDNCIGSITATTTSYPAPYTFSNQGTYLIVWNFNDGNGNSFNVNQNVIVDNTSPPVIPALADVTGQCSATAPTPTFTNTCTGAIINATPNINPPTRNTQGTTVIIWTFDDGNGNVQTVNQNIIVDDTTAPVAINPPANITYQCIAEVPLVGSLTAIDNCSPIQTVTGSDVIDNSNLCNIIITRTWTFDDGNGQILPITQIITVQDTIAPIFTGNLPDESTIECSSSIPLAVVQAIDNCSATPINASFTDSAQIPLVGLCPLKYKIERTWKATDSCGNVSLPYIQIINFKDTTKPTATGIVTPLPATCESIPPPPTLVPADNCTAPTDLIVTPMTEVKSVTSPTGTYTITREWIVSDGCNSETFTQVVNVTIPNFIQQIPEVYTNCNIDSTIKIDLIKEIQKTIPSVPTNGTWIDVNSVLGVNFDPANGTFEPYKVPVGVYYIEYKNNDVNCPTIIKFTIKVDDDCSVLCESPLIIKNAITPNGDTINETLVIEGINNECIVSNSIEIYNRWGIKVYEKQNYDNELEPFTGMSDGRSTYKKGDLLPTGTYFYILNYQNKNNVSKSESGFIYLTRE
jgi:gliding motility-associated-like protein